MRELALKPKDTGPPRNLFRAVLAALLMLAVATTALAAPTILPDPPGLVGGYSVSLLTPESQGYGLPGFLWQNVVPNALADYFTFKPLTTVNAVAAGFPSTCGRLPGDAASTEDCYVIGARRFRQGLSVLGGPGLLDAAGVPFGPTNLTPGHNLLTDVYGYGSGPNNAPATGPFAATGAYHWPAMSIKGTKGRPVRVAWINELPNQIIPGFDPTLDCGDALYCYPYNRLVTHVHGAHVGPESDGWTRGWYTPGFNLTGTVAQPTSVIFSGPFNTGTPHSQSYPGWISTSAAVATNTYKYGPEGTYYYPMDQEAGTIWYHDHAMGLTHLNTNMGLAGFFPITDDNEKCKQGITTPLCTGVAPLPAATKILPTLPFEYGYALQDRIFDTNGQLAMPDSKVIHPLDVGTCSPVRPTVLGCPNTPLFMYSTPTVNALNPLNSDPGHMITYVAGSPILATNPLNVNAPFLGNSATLEYFGNMPVVNGVVYAKETAEQRVVRMRFLNGSDSRAWILRLKIADPVVTNPARYLPFWQIGAEQGFLAKPVMQEHLLIMPGERVDVLVDFKATAAILDANGLVVAGAGPAAGGQVILENWGADAPYDGAPVPTVAASLLDPVLAAARAAQQIPEVMAFNVVAINSTLTPPATVADVPSPSAAWATATVLNTLPNMQLNANLNPEARNVSLIEVQDFWGRTMPTIDARGFMEVPLTELITLNQTQMWDIVNTTVDAHPMHLHQVAFQTLGRFMINQMPVTNVAGVPLVDPLTGLAVTTPDVVYPLAVPPYTPVSYVVDPLSPALIPPNPGEAGWKDTIMCPPGQVTRVIAKFDLVGQYVWHCHILSHEEHDMMRPLKVAPPANTPTITASTLATIAGAPVTFTSSAATTTTGGVQSPLVGANYIFEYQAVTVPASAVWIELAPSVSNVASITFPAVGTYNVRVKVTDPAQNFAESAYSNSAGNLVVSVASTFTITVTQGVNGTIAPAGTLNVVTVTRGANQAFTITPTGAVVITDVLVDGVSVGAVSTYTFTNVTANHTITASFGPLPGAPVATAATAPTTTGFTANWGATANATSYAFDVSTSNTFATFVTGYNNLNVGNVTSISVTGLTAGTTYYYRVRANNVKAVGANSNTVVANTLSLIPTPLTPTGSGIATNAPFTFSAVTGATSYSIWLQNYTAAAGGPMTFTAAQAGCAVGPTCSYLPATPFTANNQYGWAVASINAGGVQAAWSTPLNFDTITRPAAPVAATPSGSGIATNAPFTFSAVTGATSYTLWLQNYTTGTGAPMTFTAAQAGCAVGATCSYLPAAPFTAVTGYGWAVAAVNASGVQGAWSNALNFDTSPVLAAPVAATPSGNGIATNAPFTFSAVTGASSYTLWLQNYTTGTGGPMTFTAAQAGCAAGPSCSYLPATPFNAATGYGWAVAAVSAAGTQGPWSNSVNFITP